MSGLSPVPLCESRKVIIFVLRHIQLYHQENTLENGGCHNKIHCGITFTLPVYAILRPLFKNADTSEDGVTDVLEILRHVFQVHISSQNAYLE